MNPLLTREYQDLTYGQFRDTERERNMTEDLQGWCAPEFFERIIAKTRPRLILEVGSWKGKSAIAMGRALWQQNLYDSRIICIDTWLGATEFVGKPDDDHKRGLRRDCGYPTIYYQFLKNVLSNGMAHMIVPFPQTSTNASRFLQQKGTKADLIFIDASHEYTDVVQDLKFYDHLLADGGVMFGDDYCDHWWGVKAAVQDYSIDNHLHLQTFQYENSSGEAPSDYWVLTKKIESWPTDGKKLL